MKQTYIILDDDTAFIVLLKKILDHFPHLECVAFYANTLDGARGITKHKPDILFLDMEIDGLDGLEVLGVLDHKPMTIVVSQKLGFVSTSDQLDIRDCILKHQLSVKRMDQALSTLCIPSRIE